MGMKTKRRSMPNLIQYCIERVPQEEVELIPAAPKLRGIYALLSKKRNNDYGVVYIGISTSNIRERLRSHKGDKKKKGWTHFSIYKTWPNISNEQIKELEGLFLHIYSKDSRAQAFNELRSSRLLRNVKIRSLKKQADMIVSFEKALRDFPNRKKMKGLFS